MDATSAATDSEPRERNHPLDHHGLEEGLRRYRRRAEVLRQIHSLKLSRYQRRDNITRVSLVTISVALTFIGFMGTARLRSVFHAPPGVVDPIFDILLLGLVIAVIVEAIYRFGERAGAHQRSIVVLTGFLTELDDMLQLRIPGDAQPTLDHVRGRYTLITEILPPSTDAEYLAAKEAYRKKQEAKQRADRGVSAATSSIDSIANDRETLVALLLSDGWRLGVLRALRDYAPDCFVTGGFVRNLVWDALHQYSLPTPVDDVDVVFYDDGPGGASLEADIEHRLRQMKPNIPWSVKNQALVNSPDGAHRRDLPDALAGFPETASAVAVRMRDETVDVVAPVGLRDLFRGVVQPTTYAATHYPDRFRQRATDKHWRETWPQLVFAGSQLGQSRTASS